MCLIGDEEIRKVDVKSNKKCTIGEEESLKNDEKRVGQDEIDEDFKEEEKSLFGKEEVQVEEGDVKTEKEYLLGEEDVDKEKTQGRRKCFCYIPVR